MKRFTVTQDNRDEVIPRIGIYLRALNCEKPQHVTVDDKKETRRTCQNALLWKWYGIIGGELGYTKDEIHNLMRFKHLGMQTVEIAGETIETLPSTTRLSVGEMSEYMESVSRFAGQMNIRLPMEESMYENTPREPHSTLRSDN